VSLGRDWKERSLLATKTTCAAAKVGKDIARIDVYNVRTPMLMTAQQTLRPYNRVTPREPEHGSDLWEKEAPLALAYTRLGKTLSLVMQVIPESNDTSSSLAFECRHKSNYLRAAVHKIESLTTNHYIRRSVVEAVRSM